MSGTFISQNKSRPGVYINFSTEKPLAIGLSDRGTVALPLNLSWGPAGSIITVDQGEAVLGIPVDENKEAAYRRDAILSKIKGSGTVTVPMIDTVAESYINGQLDIIEHNDASGFEVVFVSTKGIPPNLPDLQNAIEELKAAHLTVTYTFRYNTYQYLEQFTHAQLSAYSHNSLREVI